MILLALALMVGSLTAQVDEMVTIPKSRLQELERKEAELEKVKQELSGAHTERERLNIEQQRLKAEAEQLKQARQAAEARSNVAGDGNVGPVTRHDTPPLATLPPLPPGETVDAMDLMNHYRADSLAAERRYAAHPIRVEGEVTGFEKPMFVRYYVIFLKTTERNWKIACRVSPPDNFPAVFTVKGGDELVGETRSGARLPIARTGQKVVVEGSCKGLRDQVVTLSACSLQQAR